ncbi:hypothetical protein P0L94_04240 [Microbacter sp. GSS18]|nr:hypothetical protein P0L94_04240 [Microbacter sp. GSS18]
MIGDWTAAAVRARSTSARRLGTGGADAVARRSDLASAIEALGTSLYASRVATSDDLAAAQRDVKRAVLWELRVLAGWMPPAGTRLARALAAVFEYEDLVAVVDALERGVQAPPRYDLGALATVSAGVWEAASPAAIRADLRHGVWGDPGAEPSAMADVLAASLLRRIASAAPATASWATGALALRAARIRVVEGRQPPDRFVALSRAVLGEAWVARRELAGLRAALPPSGAAPLTGVDDPAQLWRAEQGWRSRAESDGFRLLRDRGLGPETAVGAFAVLWSDALRVAEALAAADAGGGELLDVVA